MAASKGFDRKHYFIDPRLQGRYMLTFLVPMLVMLGFMIFTLVVASRSLVGSATRTIQESVESQIATALQDQAQPSAAHYEAALEGVRRAVRSVADRQEYRRAFMVTLLWVFGTGVFIVILQIAFLTVYFSHKVAGPIYRLEKVCGSLIEGNYRESASLRKGDELQNLAGLMSRMIQVTRDRLAALRDETDERKRQEMAQNLQL